jgi:hypothetical protein
MRMPVRIRSTWAVREYLIRLFDRALTDRVEDRVEKKLAATFEIVTDEKLMADLRRADQQADEDARPYDEIRRDLGLA